MDRGEAITHFQKEKYHIAYISAGGAEAISSRVPDAAEADAITGLLHLLPFMEVVELIPIRPVLNNAKVSDHHSINPTGGIYQTEVYRPASER